MTYLFWYTLPALVAAALAYALTPLVARLAVRIGAIDMPGERKVHTVPIPTSSPRGRGPPSSCRISPCP